MKKNIVVYFVAKNGFMNRELVNHFIQSFEKRGCVIDDIGAGNAYNMPVYLLGEVEAHIDKAVIVSLRFDGENPVPMVFFDENEVAAVVERLEKAEDGEDTFDILAEVHRKIRG